MTGGILFLIGTVAVWVAWGCLALAVYRLVDFLFKPAGVARSQASKALGSAALGSAIGFLLEMALPMDPGRGMEGFKLPLVWPIMPFAAWATAACLAFGLCRFYQVMIESPSKRGGVEERGTKDEERWLLGEARGSGVAGPTFHLEETELDENAARHSHPATGGNGGEAVWSAKGSSAAPVQGRRQKDWRAARFRALTRQGVASILAAVGFFLIFKLSRDPITIVKGGIPFPWRTATILILLGIAAIVFMAVAAQSAARRGAAKVICLHAALLVGSVVFGVPFLWVIVTSFKEDRDMSSPNGIIWIPKVSETVAYRDPANPFYETTDPKGNHVEGEVIERKDGGIVKVNVIKPMSLEGSTFDTSSSNLREIDRQIPVMTGTYQGQKCVGKVIKETNDGRQVVSIMSPRSLAGQTFTANPADLEPVRHPGLNFKNYPDALDYLPVEADHGLAYLKNTLILVVLSVIGTILSSSIVAYGFSRLRFPGKNLIFVVLLSTMMLPAAVTLLPTFLIFKTLGWIDTLYPLWVPAFFASAFNVFLLRQFFMTIPNELEDASKIDGCSFFKTFWTIMIPQVKPALAVIAIWTFMGVWNNFMGPLVYINSPEKMPIAYAVQLYQGDHGSEPGLLMAFAAMSMIPVLALFFSAQKYFIEGVTLSGLGGR